jgi:transposase
MWSALRRALSAVRQRVSVMDGWQRFVPPRPRPSSVPPPAPRPRPRRRSKREVRDRRLLRALADFIAHERYAPSAQEIAAKLGRNRTTIWRGLDRMRRNGTAQMNRRGAWEPTRDGWSALNREPVRPVIERKPRDRKRRVAAVRHAILLRRLAVHDCLTAARRAAAEEEGLATVE